MLGIALTPRAKKPLRTSSSSVWMKVFQPDTFPFPEKQPVLPDPVWRAGKAAAFAGPRAWKYCFKLDLAMILTCACDKWGVFAEMWVTSNRQDRNIFVGRVKGMLLENFHKSWQRSHQWLFSSWNKCDSQQRDDGLNWEGCVAAVCTKGIYLYGERAEMVGFFKEACKGSQKGYPQQRLHYIRQS